MATGNPGYTWSEAASVEGQGFCHFHTCAVQVVFVCGSNNIFVAAEGCGCLAEGRGRFTFGLRSMWSLRGLRGCKTAENHSLDRISVIVEYHVAVLK